MKNLILRFIGIVFFTCTIIDVIGVPPLQEDIPNHLQGRIQIAPLQNRIDVQVSYIYIAKENNENKVQLMLEKYFTVIEVEGEAIREYELEKGNALPSRYNTICIYFNRPLQRYDTVRIDLNYQCHQPFNRYHGKEFPIDWIEISPNTLGILPRHISLGKKYTYDIHLAINGNYKLYSPGNLEKTPNGWRITLLIPSTGFYSVLSKQFKIEQFEHDGKIIEIASVNVADTVKQLALQTINHCLNYFNHTFGKNNPKKKVQVVLRPYAYWDAQYAAGDHYFVTFQEEPEEYVRNARKHFSNIAHEISHFWWHFADVGGSDNWLNESLAEYSCLMAFRSFYGEQAFKKMIRKYEKTSKKLPPVSDAGLIHSNDVLYKKGPCLLFHLEKKMGREKFEILLTEIACRQVSNTYQFLKILAEQTNDRTAAYFKKQLWK